MIRLGKGVFESPIFASDLDPRSFVSSHIGHSYCLVPLRKPCVSIPHLSLVIRKKKKKKKKRKKKEKKKKIAS